MTTNQAYQDFYYPPIFVRCSASLTKEKQQAIYSRRMAGVTISQLARENLILWRLYLSGD